MVLATKFLHLSATEVASDVAATDEDPGDTDEDLGGDDNDADEDPSVTDEDSVGAWYKVLASLSYIAC